MTSRGPKPVLSDEDNPLLLSTRSKKHFTLIQARSPDEEIDHIIDYSKASSHQSLRRRMNTFFESSKIDFILKIINGIFSFFLIIFYIISLYNGHALESLAWGVTSFLVHLYLFIEYVARVYASKDRQKYLFSPDSRIDFLSNVFFLAFRIAYLTPFNDDPDNVVLKFGNLLSLLRLLQLENFQRFIENEVNRQLTNIAVVIITLIIFASALLQMIQLIQAKYFFEGDISEQEKAEYTYQYYIFDIIITISTLGYNNPFSGALTKVFLIVLIFVSLFIIPTKSSQLISIFSSKSVYARMRYKTTEHTQHIVVTGTISNASAFDFFNEFFHPDHGGQDRHGIILLPTPPDSVMESMIRHKEFGSNVFYIQGDPLKEADLKRCQADRAKAIVILCNKQSSDANEEDAKTILQAMFIKKFLKHARAPHVKVCMQILRPEGKTHYYLSLNKQTKSDQVLCVEELKLSLLAKSCLCPGLVSFVANLIASSGEPPKRSESDNEWLEDYWHGKGYEIYKVHLASEFHGEKFAWVASKIYKKFRAILFALELGTGDNTRIYTNPGDYTLPKGNRITAYVISEDKEIADAISEYKAGPQDHEMARRESRKIGAILTRRISRAFPSFMEKSMTVYQEEKSDPDDEEEHAEVQFPTKLKQENFNHHLTGEFLNIEDGFHLSPSKINLPDVTFKTMENNILATQHIILCGLVSNLRNFVLPLRAKHLDKYPPIVILHLHPPTEKQWNQVSFFPEIYFVKGSAMNTKDLLRANIHQASRIVILSPEVDEVKHFTSFNEDPSSGGPEKDHKKLTRDQEDLLDAKTIFKYKAINKLRPDIPIVTELVSPQNLGFFIGNPKDYATMKKYGQINTPIFASGSIYLSSMIDSLICQAYYNPSLITVLNQLIVGSATPKHKDRMDSNDIRGSNLYHFPVPSAFVKQTFEKIFEYLSKYQHIIPVALYRLPGANGNKAPYVVTNPDPETILSQYDVLFILSQQVPPASSSQWGAPFEMRNAKPDKGRRGIGPVVKTIQPNQEVAVNYEELGRENRRNKKLNVEGEIAINKVKQIVTGLKKMREDIDSLKVELEKRQEQILKSIKSTIYNQIAEMLPEDTNKRMVYDDDDMITASPASSVSD